MLDTILSHLPHQKKKKNCKMIINLYYHSHPVQEWKQFYIRPIMRNSLHLNVRNVRCSWNMFTNSECHINGRQNQQITALSTLKIKFTITFYIFKWKLLSRLPFGSLLLLIFSGLQFYISAISFFFVKICNNDGKGLQFIHANN